MSKHFCIIFLLTSCSFAVAQSPKEYLQKSMVAFGPWDKLHSFYYTVNRTSNNPWQAYSFLKPQPAQSTGEVYMDIDKNVYHNHTVFNYPGGYVFDFVNIGKDSTRSLYDKNNSRNGKILVKQGKDSYVGNLNFALQSLPYYTIKTLSETTDSLQYDEKGAEITIKRFLKNGTTIDYFFDGQSNLLKKTERISGGKKIENFLDNYKTYDGLKVATSSRQMVDGEVSGSESITAFKSNLKIEEGVFTVPDGYNLQKEQAQKPLSAKEIAKDVYLIEGVGGDRNIVFVNMNDYIVVTEAPLSSDITKAVLDVIHKQLPGKAVKYVHLSHHHSDHTSGIRQMVAEGAAIISTPPLEAPMKAILAGALGTPADDYSKNIKQPQFEFINGVKVLEDKDHRIEFHPVKNSHADGLSFMYLPKEGIIYEGDLLSLPEDATITPAIVVTKEFNNYLKKAGIKYNRMIGHHGYSFITPDMFGKMLSAKK